MKIELIKTKESDGDWYKICFDGTCRACFGYGTGKRSEEEALERATEVYNFYKENKGIIQVIKSEEV